MGDFVRLKNRTTGVESDVPADLWKEKEKERQWRNAFEVVTRIIEPPEVVALREKKAAKTAGK